MAKPRSRYVCQQCGAAHPRWNGRCDTCGGWNCLTEEPDVPEATGAMRKERKGRELTLVRLEGSDPPPPRYRTGVAEFDRVCGGGVVPGSALLLAGDPGIGKSTLLLQIVAAIAGTDRDKRDGAQCLYISGEEAIDQVRLRAARLGVAAASVDLAAATAVRDIAATLEAISPPILVVIDSIQTMFMEALESAPGTVGQVRASAQELIRLAKQRGFALILVGHVTKDGQIAGPRVLEHMVDTVLYFEGERGHQFRLLRAVKNRFGPSDEIGVFEMTDRGLIEVSNPSELFLSGRHFDVNGAAVFAGIEGTRPVLVEIQSLVSTAPPGSPRRAVVGWDSGRLAMVMAVLDARCGLAFTAHDVYLNVAGGLRISEPAADLAVAAALVSALAKRPVPSDMVVFGEIGLAGEVRAVSHMETRLKEAAKLGFTRALVPMRPQRGKERGYPVIPGIAIEEVGQVSDLVARLGADAPQPRQGGRN